MTTIEYQPISEEEYQRLEARSPVRHEYVMGEVFAMTGGTLRHNAIALNLATKLRQHLRGTPCSAFINDVRLRVEKAHAYYYPDLLVACAREGQRLDMNAMQIDDAVLVIEVLSTSTEATDRREKLLAYRMLTGLSEYMLVSQDDIRVEVHRRRGNIGWERIEYGDSDVVHLASIELELPMRDIYEGVPMEPAR